MTGREYKRQGTEGKEKLGKGKDREWDWPQKGGLRVHPREMLAASQAWLAIYVHGSIPVRHCIYRTANRQQAECCVQLPNRCDTGIISSSGLLRVWQLYYIKQME